MPALDRTGIASAPAARRSISLVCERREQPAKELARRNLRSSRFWGMTVAGLIVDARRSGIQQLGELVDADFLLHGIDELTGPDA